MTEHDNERPLGFVTLTDLQQNVFDRNPDWREFFPAPQIDWAVRESWGADGMPVFAGITRADLIRIEDRAEGMLLQTLRTVWTVQELWGGAL